MCFVVSSPLTAKAFLSGHIGALCSRYQIDLIADADESADLGVLRSYADVTRIGIQRKVVPLADVKAFFSLFALCRRREYDVVSSVTPKAGMLAMLAAKLAKIPLRIHVFTGQVWVTRSGIKRRLLKAADRLVADLSTHVLTDSPSQRDFLVAEGIAKAEKIHVMGEGSICGVDGKRFHPDSKLRFDLRVTEGVPQDAVVFLFLGRLNRDKGVLDLADAFAVLDRQDAWLIVVGPDEAGLKADMERRLGPSLARVRFHGYTNRPEDFMTAADVLCLPSYREGFGMVIVEAAATGIPVVASRIYGVTDAVEEGLTGLLHSPGNTVELTRVMTTMVDDREYRLRMGSAARTRALRLFSSEASTAAWYRFYVELLG